MGSKRAEDASRLLRAALTQTYAREDEYRPALKLLTAALEELGQARAAMTCAWYTADDQTMARLARLVPPQDRARTALVRMRKAEVSNGAQRAFHAQAAHEYEAAGLTAHAAVQREYAQHYPAARALWSRLCQSIGHSQEGDLYAAALARFNLARTSRQLGDEAAAREAVVASVHLLEEAADRYESIGQRERAFDCYQVLVAIGRDSGTVEHAIEGYVNLIRILREDQLRSYALREFGDAIAFLRDRGELAAAAEFARDMAAYARKEGLVSVANHGTLLQADLWRQVAALASERQTPIETAENALLAAVLAYAELGQFRRVSDAYVELAHLPLEPSRREHYARASARYAGARDEPLEVESMPQPPRPDAAFSQVWHIDLIEWEQHGSAADACADILIDSRTWSEVIRRRTLLARLVALEVEAPQHPSPAAMKALVEALAPTELYSMLSPLERLFARPERDVRLAVAAALGRFLYKRSFVTLRQALHDADAAVQAEARRSLEQLHFPHAFDPLARIYRETVDTQTRLAALRALALVDTDEAAEMVLDLARHAGPKDQGQLLQALANACSLRLLRLARSALDTASGPAAEALRALLRSQGVTV